MAASDQSPALWGTAQLTVQQGQHCWQMNSCHKQKRYRKKWDENNWEVPVQSGQLSKLFSWDLVLLIYGGYRRWWKKTFHVCIYTESVKPSSVTALPQDQKRGDRNHHMYQLNRSISFRWLFHWAKQSTSSKTLLNWKLGVLELQRAFCVPRKWKMAALLELQTFMDFCGVFCVLFWNSPKAAENGSTTSFPNNEQPYGWWNLSRKVRKEKSLMMFWHLFQFEIEPKCSVFKPLYSKSRKGHYRIYLPLWNNKHSHGGLSENPHFAQFFHASTFHSLSRRNCMKWHTTSNMSHHAKLRRAVPVSQGAPSFKTDTVTVQLCSPALLLWEQSLTVLPELLWSRFVSQMQPWGLLTC